MSCLRTILNNEPVSKQKRGNNYAALESPEPPEAPEEDTTMSGQVATAKNIAISLRCKNTSKQNIILKNWNERQKNQKHRCPSLTTPQKKIL